MEFTQQTIFHLRCKILINADLHLLYILECEVTTTNTLILRTIKIEQQGILVRSTPVLDIICVCHIGSGPAAFERIIGCYITYEPFAQVGVVIFPHERYITSCHVLNRRSSRGIEILQQGRSRLYLRQVVLTTVKE